MKWGSPEQEFDLGEESDEPQKKKARKTITLGEGTNTFFRKLGLEEK